MRRTIYAGRVTAAYDHSIRRWIISDTQAPIEYARVPGSAERALGWARHFDASRRGMAHLHPPPDAAPFARIHARRIKRPARAGHGAGHTAPRQLILDL